MGLEALTKRERQIAERIAWGETKKQVAQALYIEVRTVENHCRNIYDKLCVTKSSELSAWWFCTNYNISPQESPLKHKIAIVSLALLFLTGTLQHIDLQRTTRRIRRRYETELLLQS